MEIKRSLQVEKKLWANSDFVFRKIAGEYILVPTGKEVESFNGLVSINETGAFLWNLLKEPKTYGEIIDAFGKEYELTTEESEKDVSDFLEQAVKGRVILKCC